MAFSNLRTMEINTRPDDKSVVQPICKQIFIEFLFVRGSYWLWVALFSGYYIDIEFDNIFFFFLIFGRQ